MVLAMGGPHRRAINRAFKGARQSEDTGATGSFGEADCDRAWLTFSAFDDMSADFHAIDSGVDSAGGDGGGDGGAGDGGGD
jgi:hypothetical protein